MLPTRHSLNKAVSETKLMNDEVLIVSYLKIDNLWVVDKISIEKDNSDFVFIPILED